VSKIYHDATKVIPTEQLGRPGSRGIWATAAYKDEQFGIMLGKTFGESSSLATFIPEAKFAKIRKSLESDYREVFEEAVLRLPAFKARYGVLGNAARASGGTPWSKSANPIRAAKPKREETWE
jgi:hypothetical protein